MKNSIVLAPKVNKLMNNQSVIDNYFSKHSKCQTIHVPTLKLNSSAKSETKDEVEYAIAKLMPLELTIIFEITAFFEI